MEILFKPLPFTIANKHKLFKKGKSTFSIINEGRISLISAPIKEILKFVNSSKFQYPFKFLSSYHLITTKETLLKSSTKSLLKKYYLIYSKEIQEEEDLENLNSSISINSYNKVTDTVQQQQQNQSTVEEEDLENNSSFSFSSSSFSINSYNKLTDFEIELSSSSSSSSSSSEEDINIKKSKQEEEEIIINSVFDITPKEFCKQYTIGEYKLFKNINIRKFTKKNLKKIIKRFQNLNDWSTTLIINGGIEEITYIIKLANESLKIRNMNMFFSLTFSLIYGPISRQNLINNLSIKIKIIYDKLIGISNPENNFRKYRKLLKSFKLPFIPFIHYDLYIINELKPKIFQQQSSTNSSKIFQQSTTSSTLIINFQNLLEIGKILFRIKICQDFGYSEKEENEKIQEFLSLISGLPEFENLKLIKSKYPLEIEPKIESSIHLKLLSPKSIEDSEEFKLHDNLKHEKQFLRDIEEDLFTEESVIEIDERDGEPIVIAGSIKFLVRMLTDAHWSNIKYLPEFLLTYQSFTSSIQLLKLLIKRFKIKPSNKINQKFIEIFKKKFSLPIKLKVANVLSHWIRTRYYDFEQNKKLFKKLKKFIFKDIAKELPETVSLMLKRALEIKGKQRKSILSFSSNFPLSILPPQDFTILDINPLELARQLTLMEFSRFQSIRPKECLGQAWLDKLNKEKLAPNILMITNHFNKFSRWISMRILLEKKIKKRSEIFSYFINLLEECFNIHNYMTSEAILGGLLNSSIFRLKKTYSFVNKQIKDKFIDIQPKLNRENNFSYLRKLLKSINPPLIPYLGIFFQDLVFIEEGNSDLLNGLINFEKRRKIAKIIHDIQQYQMIPFNFKRIDSICNYINAILEEDFPNDKQLYDISLILEPRD